MAMIKCPACKERFEPDDYIEEGDIITCQLCDEELEVVSTDPLKVRQLKEEEEIAEESHDYDNSSTAYDDSDEDYFNTD